MQSKGNSSNDSSPSRDMGRYVNSCKMDTCIDSSHDIHLSFEMSSCGNSINDSDVEINSKLSDDDDIISTCYILSNDNEEDDSHQ
jgi:hypothetical protein